MPRVVLPARGVTRPAVTMAEVAKHATREDCWVCIEGHAYDLTKYAARHPGGWRAIVAMAGKDATDPFSNYHPASVFRTLLPAFYVAPISDYAETVLTPFVREHRALRQKLLKDGLFEARPRFFIGLLIWLAFLGAATLYFTLGTWEEGGIVSNSNSNSNINFNFNSNTSTSGSILSSSSSSSSSPWYISAYAAHMIGACFLALYWHQLAFFGHDIGHNAVTHSRRFDYVWGTIIGDTTGGISLGWWKHTHNVHHIMTNSVEHDPDNQHLPFFAVDPSYLKGYYSEFHGAQFVMNAFARFLVRYQHLTFYLVMAFARVNLYAQSLVYLLNPREKVPYRRLELACIAVFYLGYGYLLSSMGSWSETLAYFVVSTAFSGMLELQITLSHFAEEVYHGRPFNSDNDEWFRMQLRTCLNIVCPKWLDWAHGGLQFQIEHHLWPRIPRHNLRSVRDIVKPFCAKHGVTYNELGFVDANRRVLSKLRQTALKLDKMATA